MRSFILAIASIFGVSVTAFFPQISNTQSTEISNAKTTVHMLVVPEPNLKPYVDNFISTLQAELDQNGIELDWYTTNPPPADDATDMLLSLQSTQSEAGGQVNANAWPDKQNISGLSPLVYNAFRALQWKIRY